MRTGITAKDIQQETKALAVKRKGMRCFCGGSLHADKHDWRIIPGSGAYCTLVVPYKCPKHGQQWEESVVL